MGQTIAEKIFSNHCGRKVHAGDFILADLDLVMTHDMTCAWALEPFYQIANKVFDPKKVFLPFDHAFPAPSTAAAKLQAQIRDFAEEQGIQIVFDGVCHQLMSERHINPGNLILGADSHSPTGGGLGALTIGVGSTDAAIALATGKCWFNVSETIKISITGKLPFGCYAKDVVLMVAKELGPDGANYKIIEYGGETVEAFNVSSRLTLTNMSAEMGAKAALVPPDDHTREYLKENDRLVEFDENEWKSDSDAVYEKVLHFDISNIRPSVACPPDIDNVYPVEEVASDNIRVHQVFIGSCTNCRIEDLEVVYNMWTGKRVKEGVRVIITPASRRVFEQAMERGYMAEFMRAGAVVTSPGCGACLGRMGGVLYDEEVCISTSNRNFSGRMGSPTAKIYLASPATAAAAALTGRITDPREFLKN
ncbi:MAG: 3-isopropylmalate dehydratase large subunit [Acidobacteria bacterium]|nr:3-isopropylmalate dehydratase large subunit [Acidobacteriota bacterium]